MKIFVDTSVLIEYIKGTKTELLEELIINKYSLYISTIVYSEFMFHFISVTTGKSPFTIKKKKKIKNILETYEPIKFLKLFEILPETKQVTELSYLFMKKYNLLPNDSLILATCKVYDLDALASYDSDFKEIAKKENIKLLTE